MGGFYESYRATHNHRRQQHSIRCTGILPAAPALLFPALPSPSPSITLSRRRHEINHPPLLQIGAHPLEIGDRDHLVQLLRQGSSSLPPMATTAPSTNNNNNDDDDDDGGGTHLSPWTSTTMGDEEDGEEGENNGGGGRSVPASRVGAGAAAKGRAGAALPPGFAAARAGDLEGLKKLVEGVGGDKWDPTVAVDKNGSSPLDWAAGEGRVEVCRWVRGLGGSTVAGLCVVCGSVCRCDW